MLKNNSLAFRLILYLFALASVVLMISESYNYVVSKRIVVKTISEHAQSIVSAAQNRIEGILDASEKIPLSVSSALETGGYNKESIEKLLVSVIANNPEAYGACIGFEPFAMDKTIRYYAPYAWRSGGKVNFKNIGSESYQYFYLDWYMIPKRLGAPVWSEPYFDEGGGDIIMSTYSVPIYESKDNGDREFRGIATVDISLAWLQKIVSEIKILKSGYAFIVSKTGTIVTHPDRSLIMNQNIFSLADKYAEPYLRSLGEKMIRGEKGFQKVDGKFFGKAGWLFYSPLPSNGWTIAIFFQSDEALSEINELLMNSVIIGLLGIISMLAMLAFTVRNMMRPLAKLAKATTIIGDGNFHATLPSISFNDEVGRLTDCIAKMQNHLAQYVEELKNTIAAKEKIESELRIARKIQLSIIPNHFPPFPERPEFDLFAILDPAKSVGGDLYDFFFIDDTRLCLAVGDVSGKGVPASLFMAITRTLLRAKSLGQANTGKIVADINRDLCKENEMMMFVTFFIAIYNISTGELEYTNAGHNYPYIVNSFSTAVRQLDSSHGMPLGVLEADYSSSKAKLETGESIVIYTDGVSEANDAQGNLYGEERLEKLLSSVKPQFSAQNITLSIISDVKSFASGAEQSDDITILVLKKQK